MPLGRSCDSKRLREDLAIALLPGEKTSQFLLQRAFARTNTFRLLCCDMLRCIVSHQVVSHQVVWCRVAPGGALLRYHGLQGLRCCTVSDYDLQPTNRSFIFQRCWDLVICQCCDCRRSYILYQGSLSVVDELASMEGIAYARRRHRLDSCLLYTSPSPRD